MPLRTLTPAQRRLLNRLAIALKPGLLFLVGGTVRDALLGRPLEDIDVVVSGLSLARVRKAASAFGTIADIGTAFGVLRLTPPKKDYHIDLTLPRIEKGKGTGGHRDFSFLPDPNLALEKDLARRDFTVNAIAVAWPSGTVLDPFGGRKDLKRKLLRTVGKPEDRFGEDYVRLLRLLRFAVTLGFSVHPKTAAAARRLVPRLNARRSGRFIVPREAIADQLVRTFMEHPGAAFEAYDAFGVFRVLLPEVAVLRGCQQTTRYHSEGDVFAHTRLALKQLGSPLFRRTFGQTPDALIILATLFHDVGKPKTRKPVHEHDGQHIHFWGHDIYGAAMVKRIAERLRLSSAGVPTEELVWLVRNHLIATINNVREMSRSTLIRYFFGDRGRSLTALTWVDQIASLRPTGKPSLQSFLMLRRRLAEIDLDELPAPLLTGNDIMRLCGLAEGPRVGALLRALRSQQLDGNVKTRRAAERYVLGSLERING